MSDVTGFDFTKYNLDGDMDEPNLDYTAMVDGNEPLPQENNFNNIDLNIDDYEDD